VVESIRVISTEAPPPKPVVVGKPVDAPKPKPKRAPIVEKTAPVSQPSAPPEVELLRPERRR
jgi:hypothetical protein